MSDISYTKNLVNVIENYSKLLELLAKEEDTDKRHALAQDLLAALNGCFMATNLIALTDLKEDRETAIRHFNDAKNHIKTLNDADYTVILDGGDKSN